MTSPVTLYTRPGCQGCRMSKRLLDQNQITYQIVDVDEDTGALETIKSLGYSALPVITAGDDHWSGFRPDRLKALAA